MVEPKLILLLIPITECSMVVPFMIQPSAITDLSTVEAPVIFDGGKTLARV